MSTLNSTTPSLESLPPKNVPTPEEVRANKKREEAQKVGIGQAFKDVVNADWLPMWAFRQLDAGSVGYYKNTCTIQRKDKNSELLEVEIYDLSGSLVKKINVQTGEYFDLPLNNQINLLVAKSKTQNSTQVFKVVNLDGN